MSTKSNPTKMWSGRFRALLLPLVLTLAFPHAQAQRLSTLSVQGLHLKAGERIIGFALELNAGAFETISPMPLGWYLDIDNDASWQTTVKGSTQVGAAAISPSDFAQILFRIRKEGNPHGQNFSVVGTVTVTSDFEHERQIKLTTTNIRFQ